MVEYFVNHGVHIPFLKFGVARLIIMYRQNFYEYVPKIIVIERVFIFLL